MERWQNIENEREKYAAYLCSREWGEKREAVNRRAGGRCERCGSRPMDAVHHLTYARKYHEQLDDLQALCKPCHDFTHGRSNFDPPAFAIAPRPVDELAALPTFDRDLLLLLIVDSSFIARAQFEIWPAILSVVARNIYGYWHSAGNTECDCGEHYGIVVALRNRAPQYEQSDRERWFADLVEIQKRLGDREVRQQELAAARSDPNAAERLLARFSKEKSE